MCGFLFVRKNKERPVQATLDAALHLMEHRGPDQWNSTITGNCYLGHHRLSILDLNERSRQPFASADGRYLIVFNGEIYNYRELRERFHLKTRTTSDTEILLELYGLLGAGCLEHLSGMFAFVIYDTQSGDIFAARDRLGVKPLYWAETDVGLFFSSELAPILDLLPSVAADFTGIRQYLKARTTFRGHTVYRDIKTFPAAHYFLKGTIRRYWQLRPHRQEWIDDDINDLLSSSVRYRLISDVPVGSYLSGGLDSSLITAIAKTDQSYTVGFDVENEFTWSQLAAGHIDTDHHAVVVANDEYHETMRWMVTKRREPLSVPNEVLIYLMTREVKKNNTVVLSGEGADELFFGYDRIFRWAADDEWNIHEFDLRYCYGTHGDNEILEYLLEPYMEFSNPLERVARYFQIDHLAGLLKRLDAATMLASVEAREPFVDHRLIEYMYGAPIEYRMENGRVKAPLKRIASRFLPEEIINRQKVGFPVPLAQLFNVEDNKQGMDRWLDRNMGYVFEDWSEIRRYIFEKVIKNEKYKEY